MLEPAMMVIAMGAMHHRSVCASSKALVVPLQQGHMATILSYTSEDCVAFAVVNLTVFDRVYINVGGSCMVGRIRCHVRLALQLDALILCMVVLMVTSSYHIGNGRFVLLFSKYGLVGDIDNGCVLNRADMGYFGYFV